MVRAFASVILAPLNSERYRRILLFPTGNNVDFASLYLEQGREEAETEDKPREEWAACVQFTLVLWNKNDPSIFVHHSAIRPNVSRGMLLLNDLQLPTTDSIQRRVTGASHDSQS